jgi:prepilin-type N-terminal cleavage/methylation domain-containing protein
MTNSRNAARGFTLVELLTVVAIIVLLIAVLIPAIGAARSAAKKASTSATISTLATSLETFRADQQLGGAYPPSASDHRNQQGQLTYKVNNPYDPANTLPPIQCTTEISGGSLLVWALLGADFLGCPGFKTFRTNSQYWAQDTHAFNNNNQNNPVACAYGINNTTGAAVRPRVGPLVDSSKVKYTARNQNQASEATLGRFPIEKEQEIRTASALPAAKRDFPFFLDAFGNPILYWRADPAGTIIADRSPTQQPPPTTPDIRGTYHFMDNGSLLARGTDLGASGSNGDDASPLILSPKSAAELQSGAGKPHKIIKPDDFVPNQPPGTLQKGFAAYIQDKNIKARPASYRADSYLLVSPGEDGIYGTGDDIANFEHNGAALQQ